MAAEEGGDVIYIFTGEEERDLGHSTSEHPNIVEVYCHAGVKRIKRGAFKYCPRLKQVIIPGVKVVGEGVFYNCVLAVEYVECPKLERVGKDAFYGCTSLSSINLLSVKTIGYGAFGNCPLTDVKFSKNLESIQERAFLGCQPLERIAFPMRNGLITDDSIFQRCNNLRRVALVEGAALNETIATMQLEEWRDDMNEEVDSINQILPDTPAGHPEVVESYAFRHCEALLYIECLNLERIGDYAFGDCESLGNINLPSVKVVGAYAFCNCGVLTNAKFDQSLESIGAMAFLGCRSLERITVPLKNGLLTDDNIFKACNNLRRVALVEEAMLRDTATALQLEDWRNDMTEEVDSIKQILPYTPAGSPFNDNDAGVKALVIREWITRLLRKVIHYKAQHRQVLNGVVATILEHAALPNDIVMEKVLPFLELPLHTFQGEEEVEG